ncbi:hypothetical protein SASPL_133422 [Salvia splendens]|uniref:Uncharacterized protein n=1 Tax=Salvia splendens TaxID=180675 RepID=A0A8X8X521_SALSN|nr:hypothetical protein SASPL_133422 [Salvia splendens]
MTNSKLFPVKNYVVRAVATEPKPSDTKPPTAVNRRASPSPSDQRSTLHSASTSSNPMRFDGVEGRILVDEASEAADDARSGTESHRLFPEEGRPRNVDSPRHRR